MNPGMQTLHPYPFEKLATLTRDVAHCGLPRIALTIGEPKHQPPAHVLDALVSSIEVFFESFQTSSVTPIASRLGLKKLA